MLVGRVDGPMAFRIIQLPYVVDPGSCVPHQKAAPSALNIKAWKEW